MTSQPVKVESRKMEVRRHGCGVQRIEHQERSRLEIVTNPSASALFEKFPQALVPPASDHNKSVNSWLSHVNCELTTGICRRALSRRSARHEAGSPCAPPVTLIPGSPCGYGTVLRRA
jgi:hypothetical protein